MIGLWIFAIVLGVAVIFTLWTVGTKVKMRLDESENRVRRTDRSR